MLHGLSLSPRVELKSKSQILGPVTENDFLNIIMRTKGVKRQNNSRCFFGDQVARLNNFHKKSNLTINLNLLFSELQKVCLEAWQLGWNFLVDEKKISFQGDHAYKLRITYKSEGGGFQAGYLCNGGFTYTF